MSESRMPKRYLIQNIHFHTKEIVESWEPLEAGSIYLPAPWEVSETYWGHMQFKVIAEIPAVVVREVAGIRWQIEPYLHNGYQLLREEGEKIQIECRGTYELCNKIMNARVKEAQSHA